MRPDPRQPAVWPGAVLRGEFEGSTRNYFLTTAEQWVDIFGNPSELSPVQNLRLVHSGNPDIA